MIMALYQILLLTYLLTYFSGQKQLRSPVNSVTAVVGKLRYKILVLMFVF